MHFYLFFGLLIYFEEDLAVTPTEHINTLFFLEDKARVSPSEGSELQVTCTVGTGLCLCSCAVSP